MKIQTAHVKTAPSITAFLADFHSSTLINYLNDIANLVLFNPPDGSEVSTTI